MDFYMVGRWHQHVSHTSAWSLVAVQTARDIIMTLCHSMCHVHHPSPWWKHRLQTSTQPVAAGGPQTQIWPLLAAWTMDINMAFRGCIGHPHQLGP